MKRLIDISRSTWGKVKHFATIRDVSINAAVESLLNEALIRTGYFGFNEEGTK